MKLVARLLLRYIGRHRQRMMLTACAMVAASCMVVWVVSGYDALVSQFDDFAEEYLGRYDLVVVPATEKQTGLDPQLLRQLASDPAVAEVNPIAQAQANVTPANHPVANAPPQRRGRRPSSVSTLDGSPRSNARSARRASASGSGQTPVRLYRSPTLVGTNALQPPYPLLEGVWLDPQSPVRKGAVISQRGAEALELTLGDAVLVEMVGRAKHRLEIVGIIDEPAAQANLYSPTGQARSSRGPAATALYVPLALAEQITGERAEISVIQIALQDGADADAFHATWNARLADTQPTAALLNLQDVVEDLESGRNASRMRGQAYAATGIALLAALFIIFTTLSMGVNERIRQLAVLRAVALSRSQIAALIAAESLLLAFVGWGGGLVAGWGLLQVLQRITPSPTQDSVTLGLWCVILSGICTLGGAVVASLAPAWKATRINPLEAAVPKVRRSSNGWAIYPSVLGAVLIAVNPLLVFLTPLPKDARYEIYLGLGCTTMAVGFLLITPAAVLLVEKLCAPLVARLLRVDPRLLVTQLSSNLWRTVGTAVALTIGLGLYMAIQIWGYSMLQPFVPGSWIPEVLVAFPQGGLPDDEIPHTRQVLNLPAEACLPLAVEQPKLAKDLTGATERSSVVRQDNVIIIGLDPKQGFGGDSPLLDLQFVVGDAASTIAKLKTGRGCIVPDHFVRATGLSVGDRFQLLPPESPDSPVEYTIAGVVKLPGWHWMTKFSGLRRRSGRSAAMIFASYDNVRRDFQLDRTHFLWLATGGRLTQEQVGAVLRPIAERNVGERAPVNGQGTWNIGATNFGPALRISTPDEVTGFITRRADGMIWSMSQLPLVTLLVTSLGVINTVLASIRARRWNFGVLRAIGLSRGGLFRLILAEALLVGLVACGLSIAFGLLAGWCGAGISQYVSFFGGLEAQLVVPWKQLAFGFTAALLLCLLAALGPAIATGRAEPLRLLQTSRAAM